jgi:hypothetical protein
MGCDPVAEAVPVPAAASEAAASWASCSRRHTAFRCDGLDTVSEQCYRCRWQRSADLIEVIDNDECYRMPPRRALGVRICARVQLALASLTHKPAMIGHGPGGHKRLIRDEMRVLSSARRALSAALNELLAIEAVFVRSRRRAEEFLRAADD